MTWDAVVEAIRRGEDPLVKLSYAQLVPLVPKKRGRPKKQDEPFKKWITVLWVGSRPRCMNRNCRKRLRAKQKVVCDDDCRAQAIEQHQLALVMLSENPLEPIKDVPDVDPLRNDVAASESLDRQLERYTLGTGKKRKRSGSRALART